MLCRCIGRFVSRTKDGIREKLVTGVQTCALPIYASNEASIAKKIKKIESVMTKAIKDGTLAKAPTASIQAVLMAPAVQLAKSAARDKKKVKPALLRDTFDIVWKGLAAT